MSVSGMQRNSWNDIGENKQEVKRRKWSGDMAEPFPSFYDL